MYVYRYTLPSVSIPRHNSGPGSALLPVWHCQRQRQVSEAGEGSVSIIQVKRAAVLLSPTGHGNSPAVGSVGSTTPSGSACSGSIQPLARHCPLSDLRAGQSRGFSKCCISKAPLHAGLSLRELDHSPPRLVEQAQRRGCVGVWTALKGIRKSFKIRCEQTQEEAASPTWQCRGRRRGHSHLLLHVPGFTSPSGLLSHPLSALCTQTVRLSI